MNKPWRNYRKASAYVSHATLRSGRTWGAACRHELRSCRTQGFTLIEVLISIVIMSFISLGIYQAITQTYRLRDTLLHEGEFFNGIQMAMSILERDYSMLYTPIMMVPPASAGASTVLGPNGQPIVPVPGAQSPGAGSGPALPEDSSQVTPYWTAMIHPSGIRPSHFIGADNKMSFVSASNIRVYKDSPESEFAKIQYTLQPDKSEDAVPSSQILIKTISPNVYSEDENKDNYKHTYALLSGITKFKLTYFQKKDTGEFQSNSSWDSDSTDTKNKYPDYVEITLEVKSPTRQFFEGTYRFRVETPINGIPDSF